jgi:hypothetical protein
MTLCAIGLGVARRLPIRFPVQEAGLLASVGVGTLLAFVVGVVLQNRSLFLGGALGSVLGALFSPGASVRWPFPPPPWWEQLWYHFRLMIVPTLCGALIGLAVAGCLLRYRRLRRIWWGKSREARVRHAAMPRNVKAATDQTKPDKGREDAQE